MPAISTTSKSAFVSIILAAGSLTIGYAMSPRWPWGLFSLLIGVLWLFEIRRKNAGTASLFLVCCVGMAAVGIRLGIEAGLMLISIIAALSAWDLHHFSRRLGLVQKDTVRKQLEYRHLRRLLFVNGLAILLTGLAFTIKIKLRFGMILILTAGAIFFLRHFIKALRQRMTE